MALVEIYGDESGDFAFSGKAGASRYFIITTVVLQDDQLERDLLDLRKRLMREGVSLPDGFHARNDQWRVRRAVYDLLLRHQVRIDATILTKANASRQLHMSNLRLWKVAWFFHLRRLLPQVAAPDDQMTVVAAAITTAMSRGEVNAAFADVVGQLRPQNAQAHVVQASAELALQAADYGGWAIQRRWERNIMDAHDLISGLIHSERLLF